MRIHTRTPFSGLCTVLILLAVMLLARVALAVDVTTVGVIPDDGLDDWAAIDNALQNSLGFERDMATPSSIGAAPITGRVFIDEGQVVDVRLRDSADADRDIDHFNFSIFRTGP